MASQTTEPNALTDAEMLEALGPMDKQLRSLNQIKTAIEAYFAAAGRIQGLLAKEAELIHRNAELENEFASQKIEVAEELTELRKNIEEKRTGWTAAAKAEVNAVTQQRDAITAEITQLKSSLNSLVSTSEATDKELTEKLAAKQLDVNDQIAALVAKREAEQALFNEVKGKFEAFLGEHGLARPPAPEPVVSATP